MKVSQKSWPSSVSRALLVAVAAAAFSLAACSEQPKTGNLGSDGDRATSSAGRQADRPSADARQRMEPVAGASSDKSGQASDDAALTSKVKSALIAEQTLSKSLTIDVDASAGAVTLKGVASNNSDREKAVQVASTVEGVRSVRNNLVVVSGS